MEQGAPKSKSAVRSRKKITMHDLVQKKLPKRIFKPSDKPRYLEGQIGHEYMLEDLKNYNAHLRNLFYATPLVDSKPPHMSPNQYIDLRKLRLYAERSTQIEKENKTLVTKINIINKTHGVVDCWNEYKRTFGKRWPSYMKSINIIMKRNKMIYKRICNAHSYYDRKELLKDWERIWFRIQFSAKYPLYTDLRKSFDTLVGEQSSISGGIKPLCVRPKYFFFQFMILNDMYIFPGWLDKFVQKQKHCFTYMVFMNFRLASGPKLGQIVIELYIDYAPKTVENFLGIVNKQHNLTYHLCPIHNAVKGGYFETGDITMGNGKGGATIYDRNFKKEMSILKHTRIGVVSSVNVTKRGLVNSQFSITFGPMPFFDGKRAVFGKVIKGNSTLCKINDACRRLGKPLDKIVIYSCGQVPLKPDEIIESFLNPSQGKGGEEEMSEECNLGGIISASTINPCSCNAPEVETGEGGGEGEGDGDDVTINCGCLDIPGGPTEDTCECLFQNDASKTKSEETVVDEKVPEEEVLCKDCSKCVYEEAAKLRNMEKLVELGLANKPNKSNRAASKPDIIPRNEREVKDVKYCVCPGKSCMKRPHTSKSKSTVKTSPELCPTKTCPYTR